MSFPRSALLVVATVAVLAAACSSDSDESASPANPSVNDTVVDTTVVETTVVDRAGAGDRAALPGRPPLFDGGCPVEGQASARILDVDGAPLVGTRVVGTSGDVVLTNDRAAFVISAPVADATSQRTWYHYGGIVVDAAAMDGCNQVSPDGVDEIGLVVGRLNVAAFTQSTLRSFRADSVAVINDGSDGNAAVVRATGTDDFLQLIEYTLVREAAAAGTPRPLSEPIGIRVEVDYVLEPDDGVLTITSRVIAEVDGLEPLLAAALVTWGDEVTPVHRPESVLEVGGFGVELGIPWQVAHGPDGSFAFAVADANQAVVPIAGVQTFLDADQALTTPMALPSAGSTAESTFLLAVGPTDGNSAVRTMPLHDPELGPTTTESEPISGTVVGPDGAPVPDGLVEVQMTRDGTEWATYDVMSTDESGAFSGELVLLPAAEGQPPELRLRFTSPGRSEVFAEPVTPEAGTYELGPMGAVDVFVVDDAGASLPARLTFYQGDDQVGQIDTTGEGVEPIAPGTYDVVVSRGFNYNRVETTMTVPDGGSADISATLEHVVDTSGWISLDTHVHTAPSPDSDLDPERRMLEAAAVGLETIVNTNHELIEDLEPYRASSGLADRVKMITGQEVTASVPEHTTMYPVEPDGSVRGGNPHWYGLDIGEIYALETERGAAIRGLNHPAEYLEVIEYDTVTATAGLDDPSAIGLRPDANLWSWDFEQVELQNGPQPVLQSTADGDGLFDFWQSAFNHGERITAVGASDAHGLGVGGSLTYVSVDDDDPATVSTDAIVSGVAGGEAIVSIGAFGEISIDGAGPGDTASVEGNEVSLELRTQAAPGIDLTSIRVFANCDQVDVIELPTTTDVIRYDNIVTLDLGADANITVLGFGTEPLPRPFDQFDSARVPRFVTNPVFVDVDGNGEFDAPGDKTCDYPR